MEHQFQISLSTDAEGFLSQQCPACGRRFKVKLNEAGEHSLEHCPYCGSESFVGWEGWLTDEQKRYVEATAMGHAGDVAGELLEDAFRGLKGMSFKKSPTGRRTAPTKPVESDGPMPVFTSACCHEPVKHDGSVEALHCITCGRQALP